MGVKCQYKCLTSFGFQLWFIWAIDVDSNHNVPIPFVCHHLYMNWMASEDIHYKAFMSTTNRSNFPSFAVEFSIWFTFLDLVIAYGSTFARTTRKRPIWRRRFHKDEKRQLKFLEEKKRRTFLHLVWAINLFLSNSSSSTYISLFGRKILIPLICLSLFALFS